jgi:hypothetical protein
VSLKVNAFKASEEFTLAVANSGRKIPETAMASLFNLSQEAMLKLLSKDRA